MEKTARKWSGAAMMATALVAMATPTNAEPLRRIVVQVHRAVDSTPATRQVFEREQEQAADIYATIGVSLVWADPSAVTTATATTHVRVEVLCDKQTDRLLRHSRRLPTSVLGAAPSTGRVYIFLDRILRRARKDSIVPHRVLGLVLAHEIGHLLLPAQGHANTGLMRTSLDYQSAEVPVFTEAEAESIRMLLAGEQVSDHRGI